MDSTLPMRKKAKHTRSKLGCKTCRIRRVRCDRAQPTCERCRKAGRVCDGIISGSDHSLALISTNHLKSRSNRMLHQPPALALDASVSSFNLDKRREIDRYVHYAAKDMAGHFEADFWGALILQMGYSEPCVSSMTAALAHLHRSYLTEVEPAAAESSNFQAIRYYADGLRLLNKHIQSKGWQELQVTMTCAALCVYFEAFRGNDAATKGHLRGSLLILRHWQGLRPNAPERTAMPFNSVGGRLITSALMPVYWTLVLETALVQGENTMPKLSIAPQLDQLNRPFTSPKEAWYFCILLLYHAHLIEPSEAELRRHDRSADGRETERKLAQWSTSFDSLLSTRTFHSHAQKMAIELVHMTAMMVRIMLLKPFSPNPVLESYYDGFIPVFRDLLESVTRFVEANQGHISAAMTVVPALNFTATKCRDTKIRREAVALLERCHRREGMWESYRLSAIARRCIDFEEATARRLTSKEVESAKDVTESARLHTVYVEPGDLCAQMLTIRGIGRGQNGWDTKEVGQVDIATVDMTPEMLSDFSQKLVVNDPVGTRFSALILRAGVPR